MKTMRFIRTHPNEIKVGLIVMLLLLIALMHSGCTTTEPDAPIPTVGVTIQSSDTVIKSGYDALNALAKWQHDHRAVLRKDGPLTTQLRASKSKLWKAIGNSTKRRDQFASEKDTQENLSAALAELGKVIHEANDFVKAHP